MPKKNEKKIVNEEAVNEEAVNEEAVNEEAVNEVDALKVALEKAQRKIEEQEKELKAKRVNVVSNKEKRVSNTQKCADLIVQLAEDAKHTRAVIVETVSSMLTALSPVTVKTMLSDLHNAKYAKKYSDVTIVTDRDTKIVSINKTLA